MSVDVSGLYDNLDEANQEIERLRNIIADPKGFLDGEVQKAVLDRITSLPVGEREIVVCKWLATPDMMEAIFMSLRRRGYKGIVVIIPDEKEILAMPPDQALAMVDELYEKVLEATL